MKFVALTLEEAYGIKFRWLSDHVKDAAIVTAARASGLSDSEIEESPLGILQEDFSPVANRRFRTGSFVLVGVNDALYIESVGTSDAIYGYRVTKYDPQLRDANGWYTRDEWTSISDIGRSYGGVLLTRDEYLRVEIAYIEVAQCFLHQAGVSSLTVNGLENHARHPLKFSKGGVLSLEEARDVIRCILREEFWCRLVAPMAYVHFGWDYYMYVGVPNRFPESEAVARERGLFAEPFRRNHEHGRPISHAIVEDR